MMAAILACAEVNRFIPSAFLCGRFGSLCRMVSAPYWDKGRSHPVIDLSIWLKISIRQRCEQIALVVDVLQVAHAHCMVR